MTRQPTQQLLPFGDPSETPRPEVVPHQPGAEALAAVERLEGWLAAPPGGPTTELAEEALSAVHKALVEGRASYHHQAEGLPEALRTINGPADGPDIASGSRAAGEGDFHAAVKAALGALRERSLSQVGGGRTLP